jgi:hypothetical protein
MSSWSRLAASARRVERGPPTLTLSADSMQCLLGTYDIACSHTLTHPVHAIVSPSNDPRPGEMQGVLSVLLVPLQESCRRAVKPMEVVVITLPVSQELLDRDGHNLPRRE